MEKGTYMGITSRACGISVQEHTVEFLGCIVNSMEKLHLDEFIIGCNNQLGAIFKTVLPTLLIQRRYACHVSHSLSILGEAVPRSALYKVERGLVRSPRARSSSLGSACSRGGRGN